MQSTTTQSSDPDMNTKEEGILNVPDTDTRTNPETTAEIYSETRSTAYATPLASTSLEEEITEIQIQATQKQSKLSIFEETIIEMFNLPENKLQTVPQLPLEEYSLLDYLNDSNII